VEGGEDGGVIAPGHEGAGVNGRYFHFVSPYILSVR